MTTKPAPHPYLAREPNRHLAFGHGVHYRLGAPSSTRRADCHQHTSPQVSQFAMQLAKESGTAAMAERACAARTERLPVTFAKRGKPKARSAARAHAV